MDYGLQRKYYLPCDLADTYAITEQGLTKCLRRKTKGTPGSILELGIPFIGREFDVTIGPGNDSNTKIISIV